MCEHRLGDGHPGPGDSGRTSNEKQNGAGRSGAADGHAAETDSAEEFRAKTRPICSYLPMIDDWSLEEQLVFALGMVERYLWQSPHPNVQNILVYCREACIAAEQQGHQLAFPAAEHELRKERRTIEAVLIAMAGPPAHRLSGLTEVIALIAPEVVSPDKQLIEAWVEVAADRGWAIDTGEHPSPLDWDELLD